MRPHGTRLFDEAHPPVADEDMMTFLAGALRVRGQEILATTWTPFRQYPARDGIERCVCKGHLWKVTMRALTLDGSLVSIVLVAQARLARRVDGADRAVGIPTGPLHGQGGRRRYAQMPSGRKVKCSHR